MRNALVLLYLRRRLRNRDVLARTRRRKRWWVRPMYQERKKLGQYHTLYRTLRDTDREMFFR